MPASASALRSGVLEKPGRREFGTARTSITRSTPACLQRGEELAHRRAFIADGEDAHGPLPVTASGTSNPARSRGLLHPFAPRNDVTAHVHRHPHHRRRPRRIAKPPGSWPRPASASACREMRGGGDMTPAHETDRLAEMVCSNSFRSDDAENNAVGLLHQEMRALGSLIMRAADKHRVPAGSALAVDRDAFAAEVTARDRRPSATSRSSASGSTLFPIIRRSSPPAR